MIEQTLTYQNTITGVEETKSYAFHLNKADVLKLIGRDREGDWEAYMKRLQDSRDMERLMDFIESAVRLAVGIRTPDGRFVKNKDIADEFIASDAWGELFEKLLLEEGYMQKFTNGLTGQNLSGNQQQGKLQANVSKFDGNRKSRRNKK